MVDQSLRLPEGVVKNVAVRIQGQYIPADFLVLDMQGDNDSLILLGRLFLYTAKANIYIRSGHIHFNLPTGKVRYQFRTQVNYEQIRKQRNRRRCQARPHRQVAQSHCGWEAFLSKSVKYEDRFIEHPDAVSGQKKLKGWTELPRKRKRRS